MTHSATPARADRGSSVGPSGPLQRTLALFLAGAAACGPAADSPSAEFNGPTFTRVTTASLEEALQPRGDERAVLVNFWATWCPPCVAELPELAELAAQQRERGVRVVAVSIDLAMPVEPIVDAAGVEGFVRGRELDLEVLLFDDDFLALAEDWDLPASIPFTYTVDRDGMRGALLEGQAPKARFEALIEEALAPD